MKVVWLSFLGVWALGMGVQGAVAPWAVAATGLALVALHLASPGKLALSKITLGFLAAAAAVFALQLLPLGFLFPATAAMRATHGIAGAWPGTADAFLTVRCLAQVSVYALAALLVLKLRERGLEESIAMKGLVAVLGVQAAVAIARQNLSGTFVNRNTLAGVMAMGVVLSAALATRDRKWAIATAVLACGLVLSRSRGGAVGAGVGLVLLPLLRRWGGGGAAAVLVLGGVGVILADPSVLIERFAEIDPQNVREDSRWKIWEATVEAGLRQPLLGFGVGTHPHAFHPWQPPSLGGQVHHAHNEYVNFFFEGGLIWLGLLAGGFAAWGLRALRGAGNPDRDVPSGKDRLGTETILPGRNVSGPLATAALAAACAEAVHALVDFDLRATSAGMLFAVLIGLGAPLRRAEVARSRWGWGITSAVGAAASIALLALPLDSDARMDEALKSDGARGERLALEALALSPFNYRAAWTIARGAEARGDDALAAGRYAVAADLWPAHPGLQREVGLWFWPDDRERAARCLRRLFEQHPEEVEPVLLGIWEKARPIADYEALLPESPAARGAFAGFLMGKGRWKESLEAFERGVPAAAANAAVYDGFAQRCDAEGQRGIAATVRERRLKVKSDPAGHGAAARSWLRLQAYDRALAQVAHARRTDPANAEWPALQGEIHRAGGALELSLEALVEAVRLAPGDAVPLLKRGSLYEAMRLHGEAAKDYRGALRLRPGYREAVLGLARSLAASGDRVGAQEVLSGHLSRHPDDAEARLLRDTLPR